MAKLQYLYSSEFKETHDVPEHNHSCWELIYYSRAQGKTYYSKQEKSTRMPTDFSRKDISLNEAFTFSDNTFVIIPPNIVHDEHTVGSANIISIGFHLEDEVETEIEKLVLYTNTDLDFSVWKYIKLIKKEFFEKNYRYKPMLDCLTRELLIHLSRLKRGKNTGSGIDYIVRYLDEYYMTDINIDDLAKTHGFSPSHFRLIFKNKVNLSPKQYILNKRLEKIKEDLSNSRLPLSQIAYENGFPDYYQFSAFFKKKTGVSPKDFRKATFSDSLGDEEI